MSFHPALQLQDRTDAEPLVYSAILQRKYDSDGNSFGSGEFTGFNSPGQSSNPASIGTFAASRFGLDFSHVPLHANETQKVLPSCRAPLTVQRFPKNEDEVSASCPTCLEKESTEASPTTEPTAEEAEPVPEATPTPPEPEPTTESAAPEETPVPGLIVEDSAAKLGPGHMRKSEFLAQLRTEVTRTAEAALAGTGRTTADCPYLNYWFGYYNRKDSVHIERAIHKYAPETKNSTSARRYIPIIAQRVSRSVETWARTGEITGLPEGMPMGLMGSVGRLIPGIGNIFFKAREGGARTADNRQSIQAELGKGQPLEGSVRSRMESAFGMEFSRVRTHTDTTAAALSDRMNARAFTVGEHVAFGASEYKPGTIVGDALIAHELAHVVQQGGGAASVAPMQGGETTYNSLEDDADQSAVGALAALWKGAKGILANIVEKAVPRLRSGLRLQRCTVDEKEDGSKTTPEPAEPTPTEKQTPITELTKEAPGTEPSEELKEEAPPPLTATGKYRLVPNFPTAGCIPTIGSGDSRTSSAAFNVQYEKIYSDRFEITLRDREDGDKVLHKIKVPKDAENIGQVTIPSGIPVKHENHRYELEMISFNSKGKYYGGLNKQRPAVKFELCKLETAPTGDNLLFAKAIYAEGVDSGEFPYIRDIVYNRIDWVKECPGDAKDFGTDINSVLNAKPTQFASVIDQTKKFDELESELKHRSGDCQYTTPPRKGIPKKCRLINAAIQTVAAGDGNTHEYVFLFAKNKNPSPKRAVEPPYHYPGGNYYWKIKNCPEDRKKKP
jgi:hypothetical protein